MAYVPLVFSGILAAILAIIVGIIILIWPRALNIAVALYLIIVGVIHLLTYVTY